MFCICILGVMAVTAGCSEKKEPKQKTTQKAEKLKKIGKEKDSDYKVELKNSTGKEIIGVSVKLMEESTYPANMLENGDVYGVGESRELYYKVPQKPVSGENGEKELTPGYDIQLTFADNSIAELHAFPFADIKKGELCFEEVAYLKYTSVASKEKVDTKESELMIKDQKAAEVKAAEEAAKQEAEAQAAQKAEEEAARQEAERQAAEEAARQEAERQAAEEAARQEAERQAEEAAAQQQNDNVQNNSGETAGDGCVQDGLLW